MYPLNCYLLILILFSVWGNMFDWSFMPSSAKEKALNNELEHYLQVKIEAVDDLIQWWQINRSLYPWLHCMALNYLTIPGK